MSSELEYASHNTPHETPEKLVVLLHGYGADGTDLIGLAPHWEALLKKTDFISPHAPFPCEENPFGRQWFSLRNRDPKILEEGLKTALPFLNTFLDQALESRGLSDKDLCLVGFSQGTMMALSCALQRSSPCAGVLGYSGAFLSPHTKATATPPVFLVHGENDPVVPFAAMNQAKQALQALGLDVQTHARPYLEHGIDEEGLQLGGVFLKKCLKS